MGDSRIRQITPEDLQQLQLIAKQGYLLSSGSFWMTVEESLQNEDAPVQMHKCTCGQIVVSSPVYIEKCKKDHEQNKKAACWHNEGTLDSIGPLDSMVSRRVDHIVNVLRENVSLAVKLSRGLLPTAGPRNFDYSLYKLEYALWYQNSKIGNKGSSEKFRLAYLNTFEKLQARARKKNESEFINASDFYVDTKVMSKINESMQAALNKHNEANNIIAEEAYKRITNIFSPTNRSITHSRDNALKLSEQLDLDSYQAFFEIKEILEIIYNFVVIENGGVFDPKPFKNKKLKDGSAIDDKRALMIQKIVEDSKNKELGKLLLMAYDNKLRNNTAGHNDYIVDLKKKIIKVKSKNVNYSFYRT